MKVLKQIPNLFTSLNLLMGMLGIVNAFVGDFTNSIFFILAAGLFDFLDGFLARYFGSSGDFGKELDSLADMVTFGALPSLYCYQWAISQGLPLWMAYFSLAIAIFSALRLARFNISEQTDFFYGLPTPANAIMICTVGQLSWSASLLPVFFPGIVLISCILLVSNLEMISLKFKSGKIKGNEHRYLLVLFVLSLVVLLGVRALPYIIPSYIFLSIMAVIISRKSNSN